MKLVLVEHPFAGRHGSKCKCAECAADVIRNRRYARDAMRDCFLRGEAPFASAPLYAQDGLLDDSDPKERALGIEAGLLWGAKAQATIVYLDLGVSKGMEQGILRARAEGREVEYRTLPQWENAARG